MESEEEEVAMSTPGRAVRRTAVTAFKEYERLEKLRREHGDELRARLGQLRLALAPAETVEVDDVEALCDMSSSAGISAAIVEITSRTLRGIDSALERLESGHYGKCSDCGAEISAVRLRAMPFADRCRDCQELADAGCRVLAA
jgi:DnaK suppressor protein